MTWAKPCPEDDGVTILLGRRAYQSLWPSDARRTDDERIWARVRRLITEGFPASQLPDGTWTTTQGLVEQWIRGRMASATIGEVGSEDPFRTELCRAEQ